MIETCWEPRGGRTAAGQRVDRDGAVIADRAIALTMALIHRLKLSEREIEMATPKIMQEVEGHARITVSEQQALPLP